ncbi:MAG: methionine gamma-lyase family protein [Clostridia bacterium]|nr:methionine gamma-lyase family protein [Clostridia bacterium]
MQQPFFDIPQALQARGAEIHRQLQPTYAAIDEIAEYNQLKMLKAFQDFGISESHFAPTTGYGYDDRGRDVLEQVFAQAVGAEDALLRVQLMSGTHTLTVALFGLLRPGDEMLCVTGTPYDTLLGVIGVSNNKPGSLKDFGVSYREVAMTEQGRLDIPAIRAALQLHRPKLVYFQRSRGYSTRPSLTVEEIGEAIRAVREEAGDVWIMVDNCYGEFVQTKEPTEVGADLIAGSLIKNPGGGIAPAGGYIAGRKELVELCAGRFSAPSTGREIGATLGVLREMYLGVYLAPQVVGDALKTAVFGAKLFETLGFAVSPGVQEQRADIIQTILLRTPEALVSFCRGLQKGSPIDSYACPEPSDMAGYDEKVVSASGSFTLGSTIELSADAPMRAPFAVWMQGGTSFAAARMSLLLAAKEMMKDGMITL